MYPDPSYQPLAGITVVALEQAVAMPYCTFMLGEMGARVIKIERARGGDVIRGWDKVVHGMSTGFVWVNANKESVALDLQSPDDQDFARQLISRADVFVENFVPGAAARMNLDPVKLREADPRLIACSISGYGQDGPYREVKSYDLTVQGEAGILLTNGYPGMPAKVGLPITDLIAGSNAAFGIAAALRERERSGTGTYLDVAMLDSALPWLGYFPHHYWHTGAQPPLSGMRHQYICPYGPYQASDNQLVTVVIADDRQWLSFCQRVIERPDWIGDPVMGTLESRRAHREEAEAAVEAVMAQQPSGYWYERLAKAGIPHGAVRSIDQVVTHPQAIHRGMFVKADTSAGEVPLVRFPLAPAGKPRTIPDLGEHTAAAREWVAGRTATQPKEKPMREEIWFDGVHGYRYAARAPAKYALVIAHGTGGHGGTYDVFCGPMAASGAEILSIDLPGHGKARNESGNWRFVEWLEEVDKAARYMKVSTGLPVFVLGSSKASAVAFHSLAFSDAIDGAVTMGLFLTEVAPPETDGIGKRYREFRGEAAAETARAQGDTLRIPIETLFDWNKSYSLNEPDILSKKKQDPLRTWSWGYASEHSYMNYAPPISASQNRKPVLVTVGALDPLMKPGYVTECFDAIGGPKRLVVVPDAGHQLMTYHTSEYAPLVHAWCDEQAAVLRTLQPVT